jgi:hypothetical protein
MGKVVGPMHRMRPHGRGCGSHASHEVPCIRSLATTSVPAPTLTACPQRPFAPQILDFIDPDIDARLEALEREEEALAADAAAGQWCGGGGGSEVCVWGGGVWSVGAGAGVCGGGTRCYFTPDSCVYIYLPQLAENKPHAA